MAIGPTKPATPEARSGDGRRISALEGAPTQHPDSTRSLEEEPRMEAGAMVAERYRIVRVIGEGGMGVVYAAEHVLMRKEVALKVLHPDMCANPEVVARFEREAVAAAHIDHPNIAGATDFGRLADGSAYLVLELLRGPSLRDEISNGPIALVRSLRILRGIATGIAAAHAKGVIHRDLKPENVMLVERDGNFDFVKILDFGIAKLDPSSAAAPQQSGGHVLTRLGTVFGTPEYMAPEQAVGDVVDARADLYALGVIFLEMLTGKCPFEGNPMSILRDRIVAVGPPDMSAVEDAGARALIAKLLTKSAADRMQTATELGAAVDAMLGIEPPVPSAPAPVIATSAPSVQGFTTTASRLTAPSIMPPSRRWLIPATVLVAAIVGAIGFVAFTGRSAAPVTPAPSAEPPPAVASAAPPEPAPSESVAAPEPAPSASASVSAVRPARRPPPRAKPRRGSKITETIEKVFR